MHFAYCICKIECSVSECDVSECGVSECGVSECDLEIGTMRLPRPDLWRCDPPKNFIICRIGRT
jgi:hypothetical protein